MIDTPPVWRSLLYVPANNREFIAKAHTRAADAIILDLEDSVPAAARDEARAVLLDSARAVRRNGADVLVRVNADPQAAAEDLDAAVSHEVTALMLTKVESAQQVRERAALIERLEQSRGMTLGATRIFVLAETPAAIFRLDDIARAHERVIAMALGGEDSAAALGAEPGPDTLKLPKQLVLYAARAAGVSAMGLMGTVADFSDLEAVRHAALTARAHGFDGASCVHPSNVPVLNAAFSPTPAAVDEARRIIAAYDDATARGVGAIAVAGRMIDVPVAERARKLLARAEAIALLDRRKSGER